MPARAAPKRPIGHGLGVHVDRHQPLGTLGLARWRATASTCVEEPLVGEVAVVARRHGDPVASASAAISRSELRCMAAAQSDEGSGLASLSGMATPSRARVPAPALVTSSSRPLSGSANRLPISEPGERRVQGEVRRPVGADRCHRVPAAFERHRLRRRAHHDHLGVTHLAGPASPRFEVHLFFCPHRCVCGVLGLPVRGEPAWSTSTRPRASLPGLTTARAPRGRHWPCRPASRAWPRSDRPPCRAPRRAAAHGGHHAELAGQVGMAPAGGERRASSAATRFAPDAGSPPARCSQRTGTSRPSGARGPLLVVGSVDLEDHERPVAVRSRRLGHGQAGRQGRVVAGEEVPVGVGVDGHLAPGPDGLDAATRLHRRGPGGAPGPSPCRTMSMVDGRGVRVERPDGVAAPERGARRRWAPSA